MNNKAWIGDRNHFATLTESNLRVFGNGDALRYETSGVLACAWWGDNLVFVRDDRRHTVCQVSRNATGDLWAERRANAYSYGCKEHVAVALYGLGAVLVVLVLDFRGAMELPLALRNCEGRIRNIVWSHEENMLAVSDGSGLWIWRPNRIEFERIAAWTTDKSAISEEVLTWSPDDRRLLRYGVLASEEAESQKMLAKLFGEAKEASNDICFVVAPSTKAMLKHMEVVDLRKRRITRCDVEFGTTLSVIWAKDKTAIYITEEVKINSYRTTTVNPITGKRC